jgi:hypothetical protein
VQARPRAPPENIFGRLRPLALPQVIHLALRQSAAEIGAEIACLASGAEEHIRSRSIKTGKARKARYREAWAAVRQIEQIAADPRLADITSRERRGDRSGRAHGDVRLELSEHGLGEAAIGGDLAADDVDERG